MERTEQRAPYGSTVWIALAWLCLAATAATAVLSARLLAQPCAKWCFDPGQAIVLSLLMVIPALLAALLTVCALTPMTRRWLPSANLAGLVTALIAIPLTAGLVYLFATIFL